VIAILRLYVAAAAAPGLMAPCESGIRPPAW
jgi:hypothetical protein